MRERYTYVCLHCHRTVRRLWLAEKPLCCGLRMMHTRIKIPKASDKKGWENLISHARCAIGLGRTIIE